MSGKANNTVNDRSETAQHQSPSGLTPAKVIVNPGAEYQRAARIWQGVATIACAESGRRWAAWYTGERTEMPGNYVVLAYSDDDGQTWQDPAVVIAPVEGCRACDPCLWIDPTGKLWLFWQQSGEFKYYDGSVGVWAITSNNHAKGVATWTDPQRIFHGIMIQKPIVTSDGAWLLPVSNWTVATLHRRPLVLSDAAKPYAGAGVVASTDSGKTWQWRGAARMICASYDEHSLIERRDGSLWLLARTLYGIGQSESRDGGRTWSRARATDLDGPDAKFFIRRLASGSLLLVNHVNFTGRSHLTAMLSYNDGATWEGGLLLDERADVSYPDGCQIADGRIHIIYDRERGGMRKSLSCESLEKRKRHQREILMATFTEQDVLAGKAMSETCKLKQLISRLGPKPNFDFDQYVKDGGLNWSCDDA